MYEGRKAPPGCDVYAGGEAGVSLVLRGEEVDGIDGGRGRSEIELSMTPDEARDLARLILANGIVSPEGN
ncbi:MAG: hypothetical protein ABSH35_33105 [Isosphaeraceae bacterium]